MPAPTPLSERQNHTSVSETRDIRYCPSPSKKICSHTDRKTSFRHLSLSISHLLVHPHFLNLPPLPLSHPCAPTLQSGCWWLFPPDCCFSASFPTKSPWHVGRGPVCVCVKKGFVFMTIKAGTPTQSTFITTYFDNSLYVAVFAKE